MSRAACITLAVSAAVALSACGKKEEGAPAATDAATSASAVAPAPLTAPPPRKPGLWAQTIQSSGMNQTISICLDAATDKKLSVLGQGVSESMCSESKITPKLGGGFSFSSTCDMGAGGKTVSTGEATGDFNSRYEVKSHSVTTGSSMPQANTASDVRIVAEWKGPCPAGTAPGDMTLPGGMKMNVLQSLEAKNKG